MKTLHEVRVFVEVDDDDEREVVIEAIQRILCPNPGDHEGPCLRRWFIMSHELDADERSDIEELLNE